jgi:hypothetical protein
MENTRGRDGNSQHTTPTTNVNQQRKGAPTGFEGMNFEQQRGSYKNSDRGSYDNEQDRTSPEQAGSGN